MPEYIDLISSDPPDSTKRPQPQQSGELPSRRPSYQLNPISSDPFDSSLFNYDDVVFDKPAKKRRVSEEATSSLGQTSKAKEPRAPASAADPWFAISDDDFDLPPLDAAAQKKPSQSRIEESDPIVFTSPAPGPIPKLPASRNPKNPSRGDFALDDDDILDLDKLPPSSLRGRSDIEEFSDPFALPEFVDLLDQSELHQAKSASNPLFSSATARLLAGIGNDGSNAAPGSRKSKGSGQSTATDIYLDDIDEPVAPRKPAKKTSKVDPADKEAKARARVEAKLQKERDREMEKERKQKLKEDKAKEKQRAADVASVNKLKVNKKDSTPEMIIDIATSFEDSSVGTQTIEFMKRLGVQQTFFASPIPNVIKWRRKMNATYNRVARHWEPCPAFIQKENHVLCLVPAQDFIDMITPTPNGEERESLEQHVLRLKAVYSDCKPIYLIEGLTALMRKNRNARNRAFQAEVLRQYAETAAPEPTTTTGRGRGRKTKKNTDPATLIDDESVEDALLELQVTHSCLIHHTTAPPDSAEWIKNFTEHISTVPYRRERQEAHNAAFCMDVGQVKSGVDKHDTFVKMMQEVNRITAPMAYGIAGQYPCVTDLVRGMRMHGNMMLEDIKVGFLICLFIIFGFGSAYSLCFSFFLEIREQEWFVDECAYWARCQ
jgi:crossover junction endonuclease EME1